MVAVEIRTPVYDEESGQITWRGRAIVRANGGDLDIYPDEQVIDKDLPLLDIATGKQIRGADNPEVWARNLPHAYRAGDLVAVVLIDTDSSEELKQSDSPSPPSIPVPPQPTCLRQTTLSA
jgi:hypothetical protein